MTLHLSKVASSDIYKAVLWEGMTLDCGKMGVRKQKISSYNFFRVSESLYIYLPVTLHTKNICIHTQTSAHQW